MKRIDFKIKLNEGEIRITTHAKCAGIKFLHMEPVSGVVIECEENGEWVDVLLTNIQAMKVCCAIIWTMIWYVLYVCFAFREKE